MRQNGMVTHLIDWARRQLQPWSKLSDLVTEITDANEFVGGEKMLHAIGKMLGDVSCIVSKGFRGIARLPSSRECLRQIPMKQSDEGRNAIL